MSALPVRRAQVLPMLPPVSNTYARAVQVDRYYQLLVPLTVPVTIVAVRARSCPARRRSSSSLGADRWTPAGLPAGLHQLDVHEAL
jgi:hypothetical protein